MIFNKKRRGQEKSQFRLEQDSISDTKARADANKKARKQAK